VTSATADDQRIFIRVERSGGRPDYQALERTSISWHLPRDKTLGPAPDAADLVDAAIYYEGFAVKALLSWIGYWLLHTVVFRRGWTVHVDAPGRDPIKIRHPNRAAAEACARTLGSDIERYGVHALNQPRSEVRRG
jgi:hypothetical protein